MTEAKVFLWNNLLEQVVFKTGVPDEVVCGALRMAGFSTVKIGCGFGRNPATVIRATREALPRIKELAALVCLDAGVTPRDYSDRRKNSRRRRTFKKVPDYKNCCIRIAEA